MLHAGHLRLFRSILLLILLAMSGRTWAQGGPPMITDDPGTPGNRNWEINWAALTNVSAQSSEWSAPYIDANYGWGEHVQLKLEMGWSWATSSGRPQVSGVSGYLAGVKIRFLDEEDCGFAMSTYPQYGFRGPGTPRDARISDPGTHAFLPLEWSKSFGRFALNPEVGFDRASVGPNQWQYGVVVSELYGTDREWLFELHARTEVGTGNEERLFNVGGRYGFNPSVSAIFSVGHTWQTFRDTPGYLLAYAGVQLH